MHEIRDIDDSKESLYDFILLLLYAGQKLIYDYNNGLISTADTSNLFLALVHIERAIDSYRYLVTPNDYYTYPNKRQEILSKLDRLRIDIWDIRKKLDDKEIVHSLFVEGEDFKCRFKSLNLV